MAMKVARITSSGGTLATRDVVVHAVHWSGATTGAGRVKLHESTSTAGAVLVDLDTPQARVAGQFTPRGSGVRFEGGVFGNLSNTGGVSISYFSP